jgi:uncharacterized protein
MATQTNSKRPARWRLVLLALFAGAVLLLIASTRRGQQPLTAAAGQELPSSALFTKTDAMIPVRDGVKLHTAIYTPTNARGSLPLFVTRTPYGLRDDEEGNSRMLGLYTDMIADGYIFVFQDIRGRYGSEGTFVMQRPPRDRKDARSIDEATDTYDTIDWLLKNVPGNNGRVGQAGISYDGWLTAVTLIEPHPALKAVSEQASPADMFLGDDFHHNGAFRLSYGFEYAAELETGKTNYQFQFDKYDTFEWYLLLGPLSNANKIYFHRAIPTWNDFVAHPNYDSFWQKLAFATYFKDLTLSVPNLNVGGWWDQEDFYGPLKIYDLLESHDKNRYNYLAVGPWNHGGWGRGPGRKLGTVDFGSNTGEYFRQKIMAPWFAYWLKDQGNLPLREAMTFETGTDTWKSWEAWPPQKGITPQKLYFREGRELSFDAPTDDGESFDSYISDPANPVPYRTRPVEETYSDGSRWSTWLMEDQRFVQHRTDTISWETEPLAEDVTIAGDIVAHLFASTTGTDSDWVVKLIDVHPDIHPSNPKIGGYELMIANEVFRGRFRKSFEHPEPLIANQVTPFTIDLHTNNHVFHNGHRIMVQVQSTWFPLIDRNPQKYVPNIFDAEAADYQKATQRIYRSKEYPSNVEIPVVAH